MLWKPTLSFCTVTSKYPQNLSPLQGIWAGHLRWAFYSKMTCPALKIYASSLDTDTNLARSIILLCSSGTLVYSRRWIGSCSETDSRIELGLCYLNSILASSWWRLNPWRSTSWQRGLSNHNLGSWTLPIDECTQHKLVSLRGTSSFDQHHLAHLYFSKIPRLFFWLCHYRGNHMTAIPDLEDGNCRAEALKEPLQFLEPVASIACCEGSRKYERHTTQSLSQGKISCKAQEIEFCQSKECWQWIPMAKLMGYLSR